MLNDVLAVTGGGLRAGLLATGFGFGFRHGIDWDHIAALTDITSSQETSRLSMFYATLYALGHALVVFALGFGAIVLSANLPKSVDGVMAHFVGATLVLLGLYVFYALARHGRDFRMRSRWMLIFSGVRRAYRYARDWRREPVVVDHDHEHRVDERHDRTETHDRVPIAAMSSAPPRTHSHGHRHVVALPDDPFMNYGRATSFGIGMIHGVGAETPTQVLIFVAAAGAGGKGVGVLLLGCFLAGLLTSNSAVALAATFGFLGAARNWKLYLTVSVLTATFSLVIGTIFLLGRSTLLPAMFGG
jgi:ABC-type nickel/cobalt efflux system permease component RcnA